MMLIGKYKVSRHAMLRMAQRNLDLGDIAIVLKYAKAVYRTGVKFFFLRSKDLPQGHERQLKRLVGTVVVVADECISTVYRNSRALHKIARKSKLRRQPMICLPEPQI
jgi:hypothetical protein